MRITKLFLIIAVLAGAGIISGFRLPALRQTAPYNSPGLADTAADVALRDLSNSLKGDWRGNVNKHVLFATRNDLISLLPLDIPFNKHIAGVVPPHKKDMPLVVTIYFQKKWTAADLKSAEDFNRKLKKEQDTLLKTPFTKASAREDLKQRIDGIQDILKPLPLVTGPKYSLFISTNIDGLFEYYLQPNDYKDLENLKAIVIAHFKNIRY